MPVIQGDRRLQIMQQPPLWEDLQFLCSPVKNLIHSNTTLGSIWTQHLSYLHFRQVFKLVEQIDKVLPKQCHVLKIILIKNGKTMDQPISTDSHFSHLIPDIYTTKTLLRKHDIITNNPLVDATEKQNMKLYRLSSQETDLLLKLIDYAWRTRLLHWRILLMEGHDMEAEALWWEEEQEVRYNKDPAILDMVVDCNSVEFDCEKLAG